MNQPRLPSQQNDDREKEKQRQDMRHQQTRFWLSYVIVAMIVMWIFQQFILNPIVISQIEIPYSEFKTKIKNGEITEVTLGEYRHIGIMKSTDPQTGSSSEVAFTVNALPGGDPTLIEELDNAGIRYRVSPPPSPLGNFLLAYGLPLLIVGIIWYLGYQQMAKGLGGGVLGFGKSKANAVKPETIGVTFKDVGGADEAIAELQEIITFLKTPEKFSSLGARIPKGVLLVGPPGTGKTLLAKATAGEAGVPFFETSGSEFVEMFVGVGAARVRDLFDQARRNAPSIIFIDELDVIGQTRGGAVRIGVNDEREQTLNQLLAEIDGFRSEKDKPVIIMGATNRPEILDPALLRAGRFDRQITVSAPDLNGRLHILRIHSRRIKLAPDFDLDRAARITPGFTGADLENVMNEAALRAARRGASAVTMEDFEASIERVVAGLEKKTRIMNEEERTSVAYHESGHALVAQLLPHADPVAKVSIIPRGRGALGYTLQMPAEDRYLLTKEELEDRIAVMLGGRAAELVARGTISTGATDDIQKATSLARQMVMEFGMSEKLGVVRYAEQKYQYLVSNETASIASPETQKIIDAEVQRITSEQYERAQQLLREHQAALEYLTRKLLETEALDGSAVKEALALETVPS